jgi:phage terminase small subunit
MPFEEKDDALHDLHGTQKRSREDAPAVEGSKPRCPKELSPDEKKVFRTAVRELLKRRTCTTGDVEIIRLLAIISMRYKRAATALATEGEIVAYTRLDKNGNRVETYSKNLWLGIAQEAETKITMLLDRLGLTPIQRPRVKPTKEEGISGIKFF